MKAITATGKTIELQKDCGCECHDGPHWLYFNNWWKERNREMLQTFRERIKTATTANEFMWLAALSKNFAIEELNRTRDKIQQMERLGIEQIIKDEA